MAWFPDTTEDERVVVSTADNDVHIENSDIRIAIGDRVERIHDDVKCRSGHVTGFAPNGYAHVLLDNNQARVWSIGTLRPIREIAPLAPAPMPEPQPRQPVFALRDLRHVRARFSPDFLMLSDVHSGNHTQPYRLPDGSPEQIEVLEMLRRRQERAWSRAGISRDEMIYLFGAWPTQFGYQPYEWSISEGLLR